MENYTTCVYENPRTVTFKCGHAEIFGGTVADPVCIYAVAEGRMEYKHSDENCRTCKKSE